MSGKRGKSSPFKRRRTRHRGVSYRERDDGGRTYFVAVGSRHLRVDGGEREALLVQADLRSKQGRGLRVTPVSATFGELAEEWFEVGTARWRRSAENGYRVALDAHLLPVFGHLALSAITPDMIAAFVAKRLGSGASGAYVAGNLRPLNGVFKLALRRGLVAANPMAALLPEERPKPGRRRRRTWTPDEIERLVDAARELGSRVGQVYDYTPLIVLAIYTGMRVGELLGLRWQDVDLKDGVIRVRHQLCRETRTLIPPKTEAGIRDIPIPASLVGHLRRYRLAVRGTFVNASRSTALLASPNSSTAFRLIRTASSSQSSRMCARASLETAADTPDSRSPFMVARSAQLRSRFAAKA